MNVLLVDDVEIDREIVKRALRGNDDVQLIHEVSSAEEGLLIAENGSFDVLLLDYKMPKVDGIEMVIELRNRPNLGETAIVMISAADDEDLALSCLEAGAQDFIAKSDITSAKLKRAIIQAKKRFELEKKLYDSFCQVRTLAEKDALTGLSNRYHFEEALRVSLANNQRSNGNIALLFLDLDHFKNVNDSYGHDVGDTLLQHVTERIGKCLRGNEVFGRIGGDEFAILITGLKYPKDASVVAQRIIKAVELPFIINENNIQCGVSIGISMYPQNAKSAESLTKYADIAMYRAKKLGRNQLCYFEHAMQEQFSRHYQIEVALKKAINEKEFVLHYQPIVSAISHELISVEALIRWPNNQLKTSPDEFIPISEKSRLIENIGAWVLEEAIEQLSTWHKTYNNKITMSINVSAVQLSNSSFITLFKSLLSKYGVLANVITLEFTETALLEQDDANTQYISQLCDLGCNLALDDFGTGFSSLSHLLNYPVDTVKLDKSLLPSAQDDTRHLAIVKGLASMAHIVGLNIVAEGVETKFQCELCEELNINKLQGFFFDEALSAIEIEQKWMNVQNKPVVTPLNTQ